MDEKSLALLMIYESIKSRTELTKEEYVSAIKGWEVIPLIEQNKVIGGVLMNGNEVHVGYGIKPKSSIRHYIREILNNLIDAYGEVVTSVKNGNEAGLRFCRRLGFVEIAVENDIIKLSCNRSNYK